VTGAIALAWPAGAGELRAAVNQQRPRAGLMPPLLDAVAPVESARGLEGR